MSDRGRCCSVLQSLVVSDSLWPHGLQHTRLPCPSLCTGGGNSKPLQYSRHENPRPFVKSKANLVSRRLLPFWHLGGCLAPFLCVCLFPFFVCVPTRDRSRGWGIPSGCSPWPHFNQLLSHIPFLSPREPEQPVSTLVFVRTVTPHTTQQAAFLEATYSVSLCSLVRGAFTMATSLAHLSPFPSGLWGFAHAVPCWKMQPGPRDCFHVLIAYFGLWHRPRDFSAEGWVSPCLVARLLSLTLLGVSHTHFLHPWWCLAVSKAFLRLGEAKARWFDTLLFLLPLWFLVAAYILFSKCFSSLWAPSSHECLQKLFIPWSVCCC